MLDAQVGLASQTVVITETLEVKNTGSLACNHMLLCTSPNHAARRSFYEVRHPLQSVSQPPRQRSAR